jgi:hypothetical protein
LRFGWGPVDYPTASAGGGGGYLFLSFLFVPFGVAEKNRGRAECLGLAAVSSFVRFSSVT